MPRSHRGYRPASCGQPGIDTLVERAQDGGVDVGPASLSRATV